MAGVLVERAPNVDYSWVTVALGGLIVFIGGQGLIHLFSGKGGSDADLQQGGGALGQLLASTLSELLSPVGAFVVLITIVLVGILLPGIVILFGIGALIGLGLLEMVPVWAAASSGAFLGDGISYALGHRFRGHLLEVWPFSRYPGLMERGTRFFHAHGAKSVLAGRFIGPLRPIIPAVGGMMGMRPARFVAVLIPACVLWAR